MKTDFLKSCFPSLEKSLLAEIEEFAVVQDFNAQEFVVRQGQYIRFLPIVMKGNIKVFSNEDAVQFLLYYITSGDSCIFSFAHVVNPEPAAFSAQAELDSTLLLLPVNKVDHWLKTFPSFSQLVIRNYQKHYADLLHTTKQITCYNLEERLVKYLKAKTEIEQSSLVKVSHQEIADDLGTSREVISRLMQKLRADKKAEQVGRKIKVL